MAYHLNKLSIDSDDLSYNIIKNGGYQLALFLRDLFMLSLETSRIPAAWKIALVSPIHKKGLKELINNYRLISVTS